MLNYYIYIGVRHFGVHAIRSQSTEAADTLRSVFVQTYVRLRLQPRPRGRRRHRYTALDCFSPYCSSRHDRQRSRFRKIVANVHVCCCGCCCGCICARLLLAVGICVTEWVNSPPLSRKGSGFEFWGHANSTLASIAVVSMQQTFSG